MNKNLLNSLMNKTIFSPIYIVIIFISLFIFLTEAALAEESVNDVLSPYKNWFEREARAPKPKFIRFGRASEKNQKFIRFGRSLPSLEEYGEDPTIQEENLDELIDVVEGLYPSERLRQQQQQLSPLTTVYLTAPKRAQKFIRFG
ncbi:FMRFamide-related peptide [Meloidogyne graminicola]|uniref:FMRFamide-related peptide n=1 Tax=Meloidogyne graminicola TaxID=189291 RepID=A0A8S9ZU30_9BILA|nr:FMRFamide-related peptide [Meloidogyne graminicola]